MKKILTISAALMAVSLPAVQAYAAAEFYVEIGSEDSAEASKAQWETLSAKYPALLGKLKYYPKTVIRGNGSAVSIAQAGPINDKGKAQRLCSKLFLQNVPCFVIEGLEKAPPMVSTGMFMSFAAPATPEPVSGQTYTPAPAPTITPAPAAAAAPVLPVVVTEKKPEEKKAEVLGEISAPKAAPQAKVAVAEAIPVPLSEDKPVAKAEMKVAAKPTGPLSLPAPAPAPVTETVKPPVSVAATDLAPVEFTDGDAGWLTIENFKDEKTANAFWQSVRVSAPQQAAGLRVRVLRPLLSRYRTGIQLSVGPFPNDAAGESFCSQAVAPLDAQLRCRFERSDAPVRSNVESVPAAAQFSPAPVTQASRYEQRRRQVDRDRRRVSPAAAEAIEADVMVHEQAEKSYWAQVVVADSKAEANRQLADIRSSNSDVLGGLSGRVSSSPVKHAKYNVRLGPLPTEQAAGELCETLQGRGLDCLVVSTF